MAAPDLPDFDELAARLAQLRHREHDLARRIAKADERQGSFPTELAARALAEMRGEDEAMLAEIAGIEAQLRPLLRRQEPA